MNIVAISHGVTAVAMFWLGYGLKSYNAHDSGTGDSE